METLIKLVLEAVEYVPSNLISIIIISYLIWFYRQHSQDHKKILERLDKSENEDCRVGQKLNDIYMLSLKAMITNPNNPKSVRLDLYDQYKGLGGNSWIDIYAKNNLFNEDEQE